MKKTRSTPPDFRGNSFTQSRIRGFRGALYILSLQLTAKAPEILGLEDEFPFGKASWQVLC